MRFLILFAFLFSAAGLRAQSAFTEGSIVYSVSIGPVSGNTGFTEHAGTYTLIVKGAQIRKELRMNSGYQNILIQNSNTGTIHSLQPASGQNYAIQLSPRDMQDRQKPWQNYTMQESDGTMKIAGHDCRQAKVTYKDGTTSSIYFATGLTTGDVGLFDRFPGIRNIPLSFEYRNEEGIVMHFAAEKVVLEPVESALFRVPPDYKIITNAEYKALRK
jgi:hypothetical protein